MPAYTYTVVIDSRQALADARNLRTEFAKAMGEMQAGGSSAGGGIDANAIRARLEQLTGEIIEREQKLLDADIKSAPQTSARYAGQLEDYYHAVEMALGKAAADIARGSGKIANIGQLGAEFASDEIVDFEQNAHAQVEFKRRQTMEERREYYDTLKEIQQKELEAVRLEKELAEATARAELEGFDAATVTATLQEELAEFVRRERELAEALERTNREIADLVPKATGAQVLGGAAPAGGSAGRVTLSATKASVANVEAMVAAGREYAQTVEKVADAEKRAADERKRARSEDTNAFRRQQEIREATEKRLQIEREGEAERLSLINRSEAEAREEYRRTTIEFQEQQRRQTAEFRQELREREREARQAARSTTSATGAARAGAGAAGRALGGIGTGLLIGGLAGVGLYGADEILRTGYQAGRTGAGQLRQAEYFERLAQQANTSATEILDAMDRASRGTISDARAMSLAVTLLARDFASETDNIDEGLATLTEGARTLGRTFNLDTAEVFDRFVRYIGEGNKELVDQLGLSNQRIADLLDIPNEGLAGAEGAVLRYQGLLLALAEDTERIGDVGLTAAEKIEQSEARITNAADRIRQALAEPTGNVAQFVADTVDNFAANYEAGTLEAAAVGLENQLQDLDRQLRIIQASQASVSGEYDRGRATLETYNEVTRRNNADVARITQAQDEARAALFETRIEIATMADALDLASLAMGRAADATNPLIAGLIEVGAAAGALSDVDNALAGLGYAGQYYDDPTANPYAYEDDEQRARIAYQRYNAEITGRRRQEAEARRLAEETAKAAERAWKSAADETARNFEAALKSVPGLFGTSSVTGEDLEDADAGIYQEKADEYLRRLRDEVLNSVDYEDVDITDAAQRAGIDPNLPAETILKLFERAWEDSSLFAGGANLDLINQDAVQAELARQERSQSGEDAIRALFGLGDEGGAVPADFASNTVSSIAAQFEAGDFTVEAAPAGEALAQTLQSSFAGSDAWSGTIEAITAALQEQMLSETNIDAIKQIGDNFVRLIKAGYLEGTGDIDWSGPLVDAVAGQVLGILADNAEGGAAP